MSIPYRWIGLLAVTLLVSLSAAGSVLAKRDQPRERELLAGPVVRAPNWEDGRFWRYAVRYRTTDGWKRERLTTYVLGRETFRGAKVFGLVTFRETRRGRPLEVDSDLVHRRHFVALELADDNAWLATRQLWVFPLRPGKRFVHALSPEGGRLWARTIDVDTVQTKAGTFRAYEVRRQIVGGQLTTWYAPAAGYDVMLKSRLDRFLAQLSRMGRVSEVREKVFRALSRLAKTGEQNAKLTLVSTLSQLGRAGFNPKSARELLIQLASDPDEVVSTAAKQELANWTAA